MIKLGLRAYSDTRMPHSLVDYALKIFHDARENWEVIAENLFDKRTQSEREGKIFLIS